MIRTFWNRTDIAEYTACKMKQKTLDMPTENWRSHLLHMHTAHVYITMMIMQSARLDNINDVLVIHDNQSRTITVHHVLLQGKTPLPNNVWSTLGSLIRWNVAHSLRPCINCVSCESRFGSWQIFGWHDKVIDETSVTSIYCNSD